PGPVGAMNDGELLAEIRVALADSPFVGEGHRKVWARLRRKGVRTSGKRVLRLTREAGLLAPTGRVRKRTQRLHQGTITVAVPDTLSGRPTRPRHGLARAPPRSSASSTTPAAKRGRT